MGNLFRKRFGKRIRAFGGISRRGMPYAGIKHTSKKGHSQSITLSPLRKTFYQKTKLKNLNIKTKTNIETCLTVLKVRKSKK